MQELLNPCLPLSAFYKSNEPLDAQLLQRRDELLVLHPLQRRLTARNTLRETVEEKLRSIGCKTGLSLWRCSLDSSAQWNIPPDQPKFWGGGGVNMFSKCLQEDPPLQLSPLSALHLLSANSFLFPSCTGGKSLEMSGGFIALLEILTNNYSTLQGRLATACWVKQLHRYYNVRAIHFFGAECVCLLPSFSLSVALSQPPHVSEVHIILVKRLSPV